MRWFRGKLKVADRSTEDDINRIMCSFMEVGVRYIKVTGGDFVMAENQSLQGCMKVTVIP